MVQGFSLGGEVGPTTAYLMEAAPPDRRGLAVSWQPRQPGNRRNRRRAGRGGAFEVDDAMPRSTPMAGASPFLLGATCLPFGLWLRSGLPETIHLSELETRRKRPPTASVGVDTRQRPHHRSWPADPGERHHHHLRHPIHDDLRREHAACRDRTLRFATSVVSNGLGIVGALYGGWLADRNGRWPVMVWPQLAALLLTYPIFLWIVETRSAWALLGGLRLCCR